MINFLWAAETAPKFSPVVQQLVFFGLIFAIFYFLLIRPQQKRAKKHYKKWKKSKWHTIL